MNRFLNFAAALALVLARRRTAICFATMFVSLQWALWTQAGSIIVPGAYAASESDAAFVRENLPPARFQMLYEASMFSSLDGPVLLTGFMARPHAVQSGPASVSVADLDYWMSTTSRTISTLSPIFAENRGADHSLVASYGPTFVFTTEDLSGPGDTRQFDVAHIFDAPFFYDPAAGNLLLEMRTHGTTLVSGSEFRTSACSTGSSCPMRMVISIGSDDATSGVYQNFGEIDLFLYEPIAAGDYNRNSVVDAADYTVWRDTLGSTFDMRANGDNSGASADLIDAADYAMWKAHFGETADSGLGAIRAACADAAIPEPAAFALAMMAAMLLSVRAKRGRQS
ncbi:MAG: hypothetical protein WD971_13840 [Pirellulales bacterium]